MQLSNLDQILAHPLLHSYCDFCSDIISVILFYRQYIFTLFSLKK